MKLKVAFVIQRYGVEVNGGAEVLCRAVAEHMATSCWDIDVLTTCALDYSEWADHYKPGKSEIAGVKVRRFSVPTPRETASFNLFCDELSQNIETSTITRQEEWMQAQGPISPGLQEYVLKHQDHYDVFVFFNYLYATTYFSLPQVAQKSYLVPFAHDEWPIYLGIWKEFFKLPKGFIFSAVEEQIFLQNQFEGVDFKGPVCGMAVNPPGAVDPGDFRHRHGIYGPFLLYVGRVDPSKGCSKLFEDFLSLRESQSISMKLVVLGKAMMEIPDHPDIIALGYVEEQAKWDALAACEWLIMPSPHESLSIVLLEAWSLQKPVLVNRDCAVLVGQCVRSNGGLWFSEKEELAVILRTVSSHNRTQLGIQGQQYVEANYTWPSIEKKYVNTIIP